MVLAPTRRTVPQRMPFVTRRRAARVFRLESACFPCPVASMATCPSDAMPALVFVAEGAIGLWIWSVWSWRLRMETSFRAVGAKNLVEEFKTYGYPIWVFKLVGAFKISFASILVLAIIHPMRIMTLVGSVGMLVLMSVAVVSHAVVKDPFTKYIAALVMLILSIYLLYALSAGCVVDSPPLDNMVRFCGGLVVACACFCMWLRSLIRGDYNLANYDNAYEQKYALLA